MLFPRSTARLQLLHISCTRSTFVTTTARAHVASHWQNHSDMPSVSPAQLHDRYTPHIRHGLRRSGPSLPKAFPLYLQKPVRAHPNHVRVVTKSCVLTDHLKPYIVRLCAASPSPKRNPGFEMNLNCFLHTQRSISAPTPGYGRSS